MMPITYPTLEGSLTVFGIFRHSSSSTSIRFRGLSALQYKCTLLYQRLGHTVSEMWKVGSLSSGLSHRPVNEANIGNVFQVLCLVPIATILIKRLS